MIVVASAAMAQPAPKAAVDQLIPWLLDKDQQLRGVPFSEVIFDTTGKKVLRFDSNNPVDQRVAKAISAACDETMKRLNAPAPFKMLIGSTKSTAILKIVCGCCIQSFHRFVARCAYRFSDALIDW